MDSRDRRQLAIKQIRNTLIKIARIDDTCNLKSLMQEICRTYEVSERTAKEYINELESLGIAKVDWGMGWIWHANEKEIRQMRIEAEVIKVEDGKKGI